MKTVTYLGIGVSSNGLEIQSHRKAAILDWPIPQPHQKTKKGKRGNKDGKTAVRTFLGLVGFFRKWIKDFAKIALPITELTKEGAAFVWGDKQQSAFETLKQAIVSAPVLKIFDQSHPCVIRPDASQLAIGECLLQV